MRHVGTAVMHDPKSRAAAASSARSASSIRRRAPDRPPPDFQFPQLENPQLAQPGWHPRLVDYIYVPFTNSIASALVNIFK
jgi:hypothetical protein